jgi:hypothetical protein
MTSAEYLASIRQWLNDEVATTYKWTNAELINYINYSFDELARDSEYFKDGYTSAIAEITLVAGTTDYALDSRITKINSVRLAGETVDLESISMHDLMDYISTWRYKGSLYGADISFADSGPDTIVSVTTDLRDGDFDAAGYIEITGCVTAANNKVVLTTAVAEHLITLDAAATLTTRVAGDPILLRAVNVGTPTKYTLDYRDGYITLYPTPDAASKLFMHVDRWPLTPWTTANYATETIPFNAHYHQELVHGPASIAYLKSGPSTFNVDKASIHKGEFTLLKKKVKRDLINLRGRSSNLSPAAGAM